MSAPRLADRLAAARRRQFVGRLEEVVLFRAALLAGDLSVAVLYLHGPGGVGKTALLAEYAHVAAEAGIPVVRLDGRDLDPSPAGFLLALGAALGLADGASPLAPLVALPRAVLLIDTYEALAPLDTWLREALLPQLPARHLVVIAGRTPPAPGWRTAPGWPELARVVALRNLRPEESRAFLRTRGIPDSQYPAALAFTHGHPLALALVADVLAQRDDLPAFSPEQAPDIVRVLLERFAERVPSPGHRLALEACAHARVMTEDLLAAALEMADAHALFAWLRDRSFIEQGPHGLFPHDLARDALDADLRWRNPGGYRQLHRRIRDQIVRRLQDARGREQQRASTDLLYLHRHNPILRPTQDWSALGAAYAEPATPEDVPAILALVRRHEGEASARIAAHWWARQPRAVTAFRTAGGDLAGFAATLALHEATPDDRAADPAAEAAWRFAERYGPARPGEALGYHRFQMGAETYQTASAAMNLVAVGSTVHWVATPRLAWSFIAVGEPDFWHAAFSYLNFRRAPQAEFAVGGRRYAVYAHDWRAEPPAAWLERMGERELATDLTMAQLEAPAPDPRVVLSQPDFADAVRRALRDYTRPDTLAASPLLRSRLVTERGEGPPGPATLQAVLREAAEALRANPRDERLYRALHATYLRPAETQELAAERLGVPFSTYRYHLTSGIERVAAWLWRRELHGAEG